MDFSGDDSSDFEDVFHVKEEKLKINPRRIRRTTSNLSTRKMLLTRLRARPRSSTRPKSRGISSTRLS